jgi:hypothetical protein
MRPRNLSSCLPDQVLRDGVSWQPDWAEIEWEKYLVAKATYEAEYWAAQHQKLAEIARLIDQDKREQEIADHYLAVDAWWIEQRAKEQEAWRQRELAKLAKIGKEIQRDAVQLERVTLERRGVVRGRRH